MAKLESSDCGRSWYPAWPNMKAAFDYVRIQSELESSSDDHLSSEGDSDDYLLEKNGSCPKCSRCRLATWQKPLLNNSKSLRNDGLPLSPAIEALEFHSQKFTLEDRIQEKGSYVGSPSTDLDQAWHDLLNAENIIIEPKYMRHYQREDIGVALPEGGGYIGTLNVYHELHCLKRLHQYMYPDYYFPDLTKDQMEMNRLHNEHCIDFLRQSSMCHGDIGLITYEWHDNSLIPVANATSHQCVNWGKLDAWTKARTVDMMKPGWLSHPTLGLAYPSGEGDKIGAVDSHGSVAGSHHGT